jgi:osmoprotectant transport system ATP-binding protein
MQKLQLPPAQYRNVYPAQLSGGQMQRVGLARALAANPPILLMDEPFGALDPLTRTAVRNEFKELDELKKKTIILVTHDVQEAFELGDIIGLMDKGRMQQLGSPTSLLFNPANDFVKRFLQQQSMQLAWQSLCLRDIWNDLPEAAYHDASAIVNSHQTLWNALELLTNKSEPIIAFDEETKTYKNITFTQLTIAVQNQKRGT